MLPILPWGGSVLGMILSLKNNAHPKRNPFNRNRNDKTVDKEKRHYPKYKTAPKEKLSIIKSRIRNNIEKEDSSRLLKLTLLIAVIGGIALVIGILYFNNVLKNNKIIAKERKERLEVVQILDKEEKKRTTGIF